MLSSSSISCCEKYAGSTPCPKRSFPATGSRRPRSVSSRVVLPEPFGPTRATCSPRSIANETSDSSALSPAASSAPLDLGDRPAAALRLQELEAEALRAAREERDLAAELGTLLLQAPDVRQLRLGSLGEVLLVAEALDEALEPRDVDVDPLRRRRRRREPRRLLAAPVVPRACEIGRPAGFELEHRGRDRLEEPPVVRDDDHRGVDRLQLALEPFQARDVEVVRRLVEEQQVGISAECPGQRGARELSAGEAGERPFEVGRGEAEVPRHRVQALAPGVTSGVLQAGLRLRVPPQRGRIVVAGCHRVLQPAQLPLGRGEVGGAGKDVVAKRGPALRGRTLVVQSDPRPLGHRDRPAVELGLAVQQPEERRLAGPVRPGERDAIPALDLERDVVEQRIAGKLLAEVRCGDDGHRHSVEIRKLAALSAQTRPAVPGRLSRGRRVDLLPTRVGSSGLGRATS